MNTMKKLTAGLLASLLLVGCASNTNAVSTIQGQSTSTPEISIPTVEPTTEPTAEPTTTVTETSEPTETEEPTDTEPGYFDNMSMKSVGMQDIGYLSVPEDWIDVSDTSDPSNITLRYVSSDGAMSVSMYSFTKSELQEMADQNGLDITDMYDIQSWMEIDLDDMKENYSDTYDDHFTGSLWMDNNEGAAFTMYFTDDSTFTEIVFADTEETLHFFALETLDEESSYYLPDLLQLCMDTYTTK